MGTWTVYSPIQVTVSMESPVAVAENITISGSVVDNQLLGIEGHVVDLTVEGVCWQVSLPTKTGISPSIGP